MAKSRYNITDEQLHNYFVMVNNISEDFIKINEKAVMLSIISNEYYKGSYDKDYLISILTDEINYLYKMSENYVSKLDNLHKHYSEMLEKSRQSVAVPMV